LIEVAGKPFLCHQLRLLAEHGASEIVMCVGHLGELVQERIGDKRFGLQIAYSYDSPGLDGTFGAVARARELLGGRFLVLYGDTYLRMDYIAAVSAWEASGLPAMMSVLRNQDGLDVSNALYAEGRVVAYDKREPSPEMEWIDYGLGGLRESALDLAPPRTSDLADLYSQIAKEGSLYGFPTSERFYEIGTAEGLAETDVFLRGAVTPSPSSAR
jgi:NDP-sugar pyrophosphorylase family protein